MQSTLCCLAIVAVSLVAATNFDFTGAVKCESDSRWCFTVRGIEVDLISDDELVKYDKCQTGEKIVKFTMVGVDDDDGLLDNNFEIALQVTHNCSSSHEKIVTSDYNSVPVKEVAYAMSKNFDLNTNQVVPEIPLVRKIKD
ncbi:hypothetical protein CAEBREN_08055 [Caenorhabditis brenneri]|uniref:Uncharacterized protein n=1 Tax=Caenorhabditis brenneri TaxID=135651 RepID=G0MG84_CAEBE|nr:hypothetical protein CAEBREN_08055 [Caenorhabditis brenneri]